MTANEKAEELYEKFESRIEIGLGNTEEDLAMYMHSNSKQCALICVDEIIALLKSMGKYKECDLNLIGGSCEANFYSNVKIELEKL